MRDGSSNNSRATWDKIAAIGGSAVILALVVVLELRNEPFADPNLVVILRVIISLAVAVLGASIPGFLHVDWRGKGIAIRAGGALALFVLTFALTPRVLPNGEVHSRYSRALDLLSSLPNYGDSQGHHATNRHELLTALTDMSGLKLGAPFASQLDELIELANNAPSFPGGGSYDMEITAETQNKLADLRTELKSK